jgi:uncharacterized membrane protein YfcA
MMDMGWGEIAIFTTMLVASGVVSGLFAGLFGIGGGAVLVPVFYQVFGALGVDESVIMHVAVGSSLAIIVPTSLRSFTAHKARGAVDMDLLRSMAIPVIAGVVLAALTAALISSAGLRIIFAVMLSLMAFRLLFNRDSWRLGTAIPGNPVRAVIGVLIGYFSTLLGIGGGIMNNSFMTFYGRGMHQAVATSSGVGVLIAVPGTLGYIWAGWGDKLLPIASTGFVNWIAVALIIPVAMVVTPWGVALAHRMSKRQLEVGFGLFCVTMSIRFLISLL